MAALSPGEAVSLCSTLACFRRGLDNPCPELFFSTEVVRETEQQDGAIKGSRGAHVTGKCHCALFPVIAESKASM